MGTVNVQVPARNRSAGYEELSSQARRCAAVMEDLRGRILAPSRRKSPPLLPSPMVAQMCGLTLAQLHARVTKGDLPSGKSSGPGSKRTFTVEEAQAWARAYRIAPARPQGMLGCVVTLANFKGGSTKTTSTMTMAQGLSLRGYRVLCIDLDPQASLTTLFGLLPDLEVDDGQTVAPLFYGEQKGLAYAAQPTYWPNVDLVPAASSLFQLEFALPARQVKDPSRFFWDYLGDGMGDVRQAYDVILIDTAPALSYLTINGLMAADGLVMPLPPSALDFASASQFWKLFAELGSTLADYEVEKVFDFVHVLVTRVDGNDAVVPALRSWIQTTYGDRVMPVEIPKTAVAQTAAAEFGTVYDIGRYTGNARTYRRARDAYDACVLELERAIAQTWARGTEQRKPAVAVA